MVFNLSVSEDFLSSADEIMRFTRTLTKGAHLILNIDRLPFRRISAASMVFGGDIQENISRTASALSNGAVRFYLKSGEWRYLNITEQMTKCANGDVGIASRLSGREVMAVFLTGGDSFTVADLSAIAGLVDSVRTTGASSVSIIAPAIFDAGILESPELPWFPSLPSLFSARTGVDFYDHLPYLFADDYRNMGMLGAFWEVVGSQFIDSVKRLGCGIAVRMSTRSLMNAAVLSCRELPVSFIPSTDIDDERRIALIKLLAGSNGQIVEIVPPGFESPLSDVALGVDSLLRVDGFDSFIPDFVNAPRSSETCLLCPSASIMGTLDRKQRRDLIDDLADIARDLAGSGYLFDVISEWNADLIRTRDYRALVMPPCPMLTKTALDGIEKFTRHGKVAVFHPPPDLIDGVGSVDAPLLENIISRRTRMIKENHELINFLDENVEPEIRVYEREMNYRSRSVAIDRRVSNRTSLFSLANIGGRSMIVLIEVDGTREVSFVRSDGRIRRSDYWHANGRTYLETTLRPNRPIFLFVQQIELGGSDE